MYQRQYPAKYKMCSAWVLGTLALVDTEDTKNVLQASNYHVLVSTQTGIYDTLPNL